MFIKHNFIVALFLATSSFVYSASQEELNKKLWVATRDCDPEGMRRLIAAGASVNIQNKHGITPIHKAAYFDHFECTRLLIKAGARVNVQTNHGLTPLHCAVKSSNSMITMLLLTAGANPNIKDNAGGTALQHASTCHIFYILLTYNALLNQESFTHLKNNMPLILSIAYMYNDENPEFLHRNLTSPEEKTMLDNAAYLYHTALIKQLVDNRFKPSQRCKEILEAEKNKHATELKLLCKQYGARNSLELIQRRKRWGR